MLNMFLHLVSMVNHTKFKIEMTLAYFTTVINIIGNNHSSKVAYFVAIMLYNCIMSSNYNVLEGQDQVLQTFYLLTFWVHFKVKMKSIFFYKTVYCLSKKLALSFLP